MNTTEITTWYLKASKAAPEINTSTHTFKGEAAAVRWARRNGIKIVRAEAEARLWLENQADNDGIMEGFEEWADVMILDSRTSTINWVEGFTPKPKNFITFMVSDSAPGDFEFPFQLLTHEQAVARWLEGEGEIGLWCGKISFKRKNGKLKAYAVEGEP